MDDRTLFWIIIALTLGALVLDWAIKHNKRRRPVIMMARPMTRYERDHR